MNWLWLTGIVIALDQITKQLAEARLELYRPYPLFDGWFNFTLVYNEGAAFSFLSDAGGWQRWFFMILSAAISVVLFVWLRRLSAGERVLAIGLALILGGAIGNLIDRTLFGHVIDFIDVYYQQHHWPAFNIADSAIFLGACCLIIDMFKEQEDD